MSSISVELKNVAAAYGKTRVLHDFSFVVRDGEFIALLGASGCGKTTVLKILAGLLAPLQGTVRLDGSDVTHIPTEKRGAVMVFQKPLLFPFLTVGENVAFGLRMRKRPPAEIQEKVAEALQWVRLSGYEKRMPHELSGGQEQRVALARALATRPRVLLLDEPFSALDANLRQEMRLLVKTLQRRLGVTAIFVTHDQEEAIFMADRIAFMSDGGLDQFAPPREFFVSPQTVAAARFFGWKVFEGAFQNGEIQTEIGKFTKPDALASHLFPNNVFVAFHPTYATLTRTDERANLIDCIRIPVQVESVVDLGRTARYIVQPLGGEVHIGLETATALGFQRRQEAILEVPLDTVNILVA